VIRLSSHLSCVYHSVIEYHYLAANEVKSHCDCAEEVEAEIVTVTVLTKTAKVILVVKKEIVEVIHHGTISRGTVVGPSHRTTCCQKKTDDSGDVQALQLLQHANKNGKLFQYIPIYILISVVFVGEMLQ